MTPKTRTAVQVGLGPIGGRIVRSARNCGIEFVGAVDVDPDKRGRDLGAVADLGTSTGVTVTDDLETALENEPDVAVHATGSTATSARRSRWRCSRPRSAGTSRPARRPSSR